MASGFRHGKNAIVSIAGQDLSAYLNDGELTIDVDTAETTVFGNSWKTYLEGIAGGKFAAKGYFDPTSSTGPQAKVTGMIGNGSGTVVFNPAGTATGELKRTFLAILSNYQEASTVGGAVTWTASLQITGPVTFGAN